MGTCKEPEMKSKKKHKTKCFIIEHILTQARNKQKNFDDREIFKQSMQIVKHLGILETLNEL